MSLDIASLPSSDLDPFSIDFFDNPFPDHERLREAGPVVWLERYGIYAVARHAEVHQVLNDWGTFCSSRGVGLQDFSREKPWRQPSLVLETDPPEHDRARKVLARVLSPVTMRELRDGFAAAADAMVAGLIGRKLDGIADLAEAFPLSVFPDRIGLTQDGREHLLPYAGLAFNAFGPDNALRREAMARAAPHIAWVTEQCRRENLSPDSIGARIHAAADSGEVTADEATLLVRSLLTAGIDTTVNGIGAALYCLARFPDQFAALRADPKLARNAFEEAVRFESPVQTFFRTTTRETELSGVPLPEGTKVLMFLASANRDPRRWDRADAYDITRKTSGHVGFGSGVHMCVGQLVARLEGEVVLEALARHATGIEIAGMPVRSYNNTLRGLKALPLHIR
ncbi:cytochrome P450 [Paracoccus litorisediminis]|uniref:Cytochrome P450 n=1 Tax=Paracoccus litorisediminis TaxID=2006130 RepID=A0A844HVE0_9RHOB|nr:cytochrome P450 [Paracoccus litorisediminis]MTH62275.1 cytochrome P450 [Paracoccus litorisediminis]